MLVTAAAAATAATPLSLSPRFCFHGAGYIPSTCLRCEPHSQAMAASTSVDAECPSSLRHVEEAGELEALVQRVVASGGQEAAAALPRFAAIVSGSVGSRCRCVLCQSGRHNNRVPCHPSSPTPLPSTSPKLPIPGQQVPGAAAAAGSAAGGPGAAAGSPATLSRCRAGRS